MKFTVLCNGEPIGQVELDAEKGVQSAPLRPFPAFERIRSILEGAADARFAMAQRIGEAMPESFFASVAEELSGRAVGLRRLSPEDIDGEYPEFAAILRREAASGTALTTSSLRFSLAAEYADLPAVASAFVRIYMPSGNARSAGGIQPRVIVAFKP